MEHEACTADNTTRFSRNFLLLLLTATGLLLFVVIRDFILAIVLAAVFAVLFYPLHRRFLSMTGGNRGLSAMLTCIVFFLVLLVPVFFVSNLIVAQAVELYQSIEPVISGAADKGAAAGAGKLLLPWLPPWLHLEGVDWQAILQENTRAISGYLGKIVNTTSRTTIVFFIDLFVLLYGMYYFLRDSDATVRRLRYLLPMSERYKDALIERFFSISRATVRGTLLIGLLQGGVGAITLLAFGVSTWLLWGIVMVILSIIPVLGNWTVMVPAGIYMITQGRIWEGITLIAISTVIISSIDNLFRPVLVGRGVRMSNLMILVSTLGGLAVFGLTGFIIGPLIAALFLTLLDIYGIEFRHQLHEKEKGSE
jgi:predicted PurR-regulated permease PerM